MKIISGKYKGRNLEGHNLDGTRPTMERVKESLFAIIQNYVDNAVVLDLFSGSGNLGIEALSEGASFAYLVDFNKKAADTIRKNLNAIGIKDAEVINLDYKKALNYLKDKKIDLIFLDPPYATNYIEESIALIEKNDLLANNGLIICESDNLNRIVYSNKYTSIKEKK